MRTYHLCLVQVDCLFTLRRTWAVMGKDERGDEAHGNWDCMFRSWVRGNNRGAWHDPPKPALSSPGIVDNYVHNNNNHLPSLSLCCQEYWVEKEEIGLTVKWVWFISWRFKSDVVVVCWCIKCDSFPSVWEVTNTLSWLCGISSKTTYMWPTPSFLVPMSPTTVSALSKCVFICTIITMTCQEEEANLTVFIPSPRAISKHNSPDIYGIRHKTLKLLSKFPYCLKVQEGEGKPYFLRFFLF